MLDIFVHTKLDGAEQPILYGDKCEKVEFTLIPIWLICQNSLVPWAYGAPILVGGKPCNYSNNDRCAKIKHGCVCKFVKFSRLFLTNTSRA